MNKIWIIGRYAEESSMLGVYSTKEKAVARLTEIKDEDCMDDYKIKDHGTSVTLERKNDYYISAFEYEIDSDRSIDF